MSTTPVLFSTNRGVVKVDEQTCYIIRMTASTFGNAVYMETIERWTPDAHKATMFADYEAAEQMVQELRSRPPHMPVAARLFAASPVVEAVPLVGAMMRSSSPRLRKR